MGKKKGGKGHGGGRYSDSRAKNALEVTGLVAFSSLFAIPLCEWLKATSQMEDPLMVFLAGIFFCFLCISLFTYALLSAYPSDLPSGFDRIYYYVFCVFSFSAVVDLLIGMTLDGFVDSVDFYLHTGEPYLKSSYGSFINWWDGTFHYLLYLAMTYLLTLRTGSLSDRVRGIGFVWVGSIMNSLVVFLPGNVAGKFGHELKWSYLLNVPYVLFPILFALRLFSQPTPPAPSPKPKPAAKRAVDAVLLLGLICSVAAAFLRFFAAIGSPAPPATWWLQNVEPYLGNATLYPLLQSAIYAAYFVPYYLFGAGFLARELEAKEQWFVDWTNVFVGAALQAQFSFVGPSLHNIPTYPDPTWVGVPEQGWQWFWAVNGVLLTALPVLVWLRVVWF